jgi:hypothetical protein
LYIFLHSRLEYLATERAVVQAEAATEALFGTSISQMRTEDILSVLEEGRQSFLLPRDEIVGKPVVQLAAKHNLTASVCELRRSSFLMQILILQSGSQTNCLEWWVVFKWRSHT